MKKIRIILSMIIIAAIVFIAGCGTIDTTGDEQLDQLVSDTMTDIGATKDFKMTSVEIDDEHNMAFVDINYESKKLKFWATKLDDVWLPMQLSNKSNNHTYWDTGFPVLVDRIYDVNTDALMKDQTTFLKTITFDDSNKISIAIAPYNKENYCVIYGSFDGKRYKNEFAGLAMATVGATALGADKYSAYVNTKDDQGGKILGRMLGAGKENPKYYGLSVYQNCDMTLDDESAAWGLKVLQSMGYGVDDMD